MRFFPGEIFLWLLGRVVSWMIQGLVQIPWTLVAEGVLDSNLDLCSFLHCFERIPEKKVMCVGDGPINTI